MAHPNDVNGLDGNVSGDLDGPDPLHREAVRKQEEVLPIDFSLEQKEEHDRSINQSINENIDTSILCHFNPN